jgi:hypothetical protein
VTDDVERQRPRRIDPRTEAWAFVELFALCGFAVAQPVLSVFGRAPEVFIFHGAGARDIVEFAVLLVVVPPTALWLCGLVVGVLAGATARRHAHRATVGLLVALLAVQVLRRATPLDGATLAVVAGAAAVAASVVAARPSVRTWLRFASFGPVAFALLFLFSSSVAPLVRADAAGAQAVEGVDANGTPVVVLLFDELPTVSLLDGDGGIDRERFPNLAALADDATWFRNHTTVADYTQPAVVAALTGRYPPREPAKPSWGAHPDNLFRLVGGAYDMHVSEALTVLCPPTVCDASGSSPTTAGTGAVAAEPVGHGRGSALTPVLREARRIYRELVALHEPDTNPVATLSEELAAVGDTTTTTLDPIAPEPDPDVSAPPHRLDFDAEFRKKIQPVRATEFVDSLTGERPGDRPDFWFLHLVLPHNPFHILPDGRLYEVPADTTSLPGLEGSLGWSTDPWPALSARQRHLLQARYVDAFVGDVMARLRATGLYDRAAIVVTADHGAAFVPGASFRQFEAANATQIAFTPLIVKRPGRTDGEVSDRNVESIDLLPTIADLLDVRLPWPIDGRSAFDPRPRDPATKTFVSVPLTAEDADEIPRVTLDAPALLREMLRQPLLAPGAGADVDLAILRTAPHGDLLLRPVATLPAAPADGRGVEVDHGDAFADVDTAGKLPLFVRGWVDDPSTGDTVVVAVNGRVAGTSSVFDDHGRHGRFTLLVPPDLVHAGRNDLAVYLLVGDGADRALAPLEVS